MQVKFLKKYFFFLNEWKNLLKIIEILKNLRYNISKSAYWREYQWVKFGDYILNQNLVKKNKLEDKVTNELIRRKIVAIGWTLREDIYNELTNEDKIKVEENEKTIKNDFEKYKEIIEKNSYKTIRDNKRKFFLEK